MEQNENTLSNAATFKRDKTQPEPCLIQWDYAASGGKEQGMIKEFLLEGKQNAVPSQKLADLVGCKSVRELQQIIAEERAAGAVILSTCQDGGGYFLPNDILEVKEFIRTLESRGRNTLLALKSAKEYLSKVEGAE